MSNNGWIQALQSCITLVATTLDIEQSILEVDQGQTRFGKQTFIFYKVRTGTFVGNTGNTPVDQRTTYVQVNVDPPNVATFTDASNWIPFSE
jgi:hypothetical protein